MTVAAYRAVTLNGAHKPMLATQWSCLLQSKLPPRRGAAQSMSYSTRISISFTRMQPPRQTMPLSTSVRRSRRVTVSYYIYFYSVIVRADKASSTPRPAEGTDVVVANLVTCFPQNFFTGSSIPVSNLTFNDGLIKCISVFTAV
ncbi:hypothetical protein EVAR_91505_1 [Eumeta japonica]|uniref:Uncharacterized protein n=1 Tax=Eumeta variegata TaxID=151549 RepID=A0A4C1VDD1_EUMVA|nr:hypothetical protein EVAR_91505_1 [Eumeta japonica]